MYLRLSKELRGGWSAFWWNVKGKMADIDLKERYDPHTNRSDEFIESLLQSNWNSGYLQPYPGANDFKVKRIINSCKNAYRNFSLICQIQFYLLEEEKDCPVCRYQSILFFNTGIQNNKVFLVNDIYYIIYGKKLFVFSETRYQKIFLSIEMFQHIDFHI